VREVLWVGQEPRFDLPDGNAKHEVLVLRFFQPLFNERPRTGVLIQIGKDDEGRPLGRSVPTGYGAAQVAKSTLPICGAYGIPSIQVAEYPAENSLAELVLDGEVYWNYAHSTKSS